MSYLLNSFQSVPQTQPLPGQVQNSARGFSWQVDEWTRLRRFLILGSEGGSYYASERELTLENAEAVRACIKANGPKALAEIVSVSEQGLAPKNDPALFALAIAASEGDAETKRIALNELPKVARTGTHLFHFAAYCNAMRGWGRGLRRAIADWYTSQTPDALALQAVKYKQRDGWSHRDLLRLAHPVAENKGQAAVFRYITRGEVAESAPALVRTHAAIHDKNGPAVDLISEITTYRLPREALPTETLNFPFVWEALLPHMGLTAMIRNLATMTRVGLLVPRSEAMRHVMNRLGDPEALQSSRVHPIQILAALWTYQNGRGDRGKHTWTPVPKIVDALDAAFYMAFKNVVPTGKRIMLGVDVSSSMDGGSIAGLSGMTPRMGAMAMAMVTMATEEVVWPMAFSHQLVPLKITPRTQLKEAVEIARRMEFGGTDCALPMRYAGNNNVPIDAFVVYTDSETWAGQVHPSIALKAYRGYSGINSKLVVVGMVANQFSIADPNDPGMLDVVGFDSSAPQVIADFIRG